MAEVMKLLGGKNEDVAKLLKQKLCDKGFDAFIYESPIDRIKKQVEAGEKPSLNLYFAGKNAIADFVKDMDLVITLCDVPSGRPSFGMSKGGGEIPWYVYEIPVVVVGCGQPTMLADVPQARTYINTYDAKNNTLDALVDKLTSGAEAFTGVDPIDSFCGLFDARL
jgi:beta-N-acetylhexosaminidase